MFEAIIHSDMLEAAWIGSDIIESERFQKAEETVHHHTTTVAAHSLRVASVALHLARLHNRRGEHPVDEREVVECALLHDIGMTEDAVHDSAFVLKCFRHPKRSAEIAREEYGVSEAVAGAISCHMWPTTPVPPSSTVGWLVLAADKICSVYEVGGGT